MLRSLSLSIAFVVCNVSFAQNTCSINENLNDYFYAVKKTYGERSFVMTRATMGKEECGEQNVSSQYLQYLLTHFNSTIDTEDLMDFEDSVKLQTSFIQSLEADTEFRSLLKQLDDAREGNGAIEDTVSFSSLMDVAVKFFDIKGLTEEGDYKGKVCAGINGIKATVPNRQPHIESFCFSSILEALTSEEYGLYEEFVNGIKDLYSVNLGVDREERVLRAQGAMYFYMKNSEVLQKVIRDSYEKQKDVLPFVLQ